ncbi:hypothetical protein GF362_01585 [Candidatus Dojkabacteria bacterium]|nr:hypothetical protein [Candidatus Dojkabacteria bacterium]
MTTEGRPEQDNGTKATKVNFAVSGEPINSKGELESSLMGYEMVPKFTTLGEPGKTGLAVVFNGTVVSAIRHPKLIPSSYDPKTNEVEYYGKQSYNHLETSMAEALGVEYSQEMASRLLQQIKEKGIRQVAETTGFGKVGIEEEALHFNAFGEPFKLDDDEQVEVQDNVKEVALSPSLDVFDQAVKVAESRITEAEKRPENIVTSTSFSMLTTPDGMRMNSSEINDIGAYVNAITTYMVDNYFSPNDPVVQTYWDSIAKSAGYEDFYDLKDTVGNLSPLAFCASHASLGLRSERVDGSWAIGLEEGIAVSDMFNSDFGTLLEWMTYSTPIAFGERLGTEVDGEIKYPKDARAVARLASRTTYPGDFLRTPEEFRNRIVNNMINGVADRMDRAAYMHYHDDLGEDVACAHGRVRFRVTGGSGKDKFSNQLGRVEFTGGPATPDMIALISRDAMLKLMGIAAYEAVAHGVHPSNYFKTRFPSMATCNEHIELAHAYNFEGHEHPKVANLLAEGQSFLDYMKREYPNAEIEYLVELAQLGLNKLSESTEARTLEEYLDDPKGNISDVMSHMWEDGYSALEIAEAVADFERKQSHKVLEHGGDILGMVKNNRDT